MKTTIMKLVGGLAGKGDTARSSYSQCGEDLIADFVFQALGISTPSYLDLGAHHPTHLSNTYFFYLRGSMGVCVEPDPVLHAAIEKVRKRDICLNVGVALSEKRVADFYVMSGRTLNTFSLAEAERYESYGTHKIEEVIQIPLVTANSIVKNNFKSAPNFISLDIEGLDLEVLMSFDFSVYRPEVLCVETITYTEDNSESKVEEIAELMNERGYMTYADTYINTIFVDKHAWENR